MDMQILKRHFNKIGAELKIEEKPTFRERRWRNGGWTNNQRNDFSIDILENVKPESFLLTLFGNVLQTTDFQTVDIRPKDRHLLLMTKTGKPKEFPAKFLCGHDERHWFVAEAASGAKNVEEAKELLKPKAVVESQHKRKVRKKNWHKRHNAGFVRQGEWFFVPKPDFVVADTRLILKNEPLSRGWGSKPHIVSEIYRTGGELVYVCRQYPNGLTSRQYKKLVKRSPRTRYLDWRTLRRNPLVYARGKVRHKDHATITLRYWHQVAMNQESTSKHVAFLD